MKATHETDKNVSDAEDTDTLDDRTEKALTQCLTVTPAVEGDEYTVEAQSKRRDVPRRRGRRNMLVSRRGVQPRRDGDV